MPFLSNFVSAFEKCHFFLRTTNRNTKKASKKVMPPLPIFDHCTAKNTDIALKFGVRIVCMYFKNIYSSCSDNSEILDVTGIRFFLKNRFFYFGGRNRNISKSETFCRALNFASFDIFGLRFTSSLYILVAGFHYW